MRYEFYYWPGIQGRGEFVRLALEQAGADYVDVARGSEEDGQGVAAMRAVLADGAIAAPPFAPPFLKAGEKIVAHAAAILMFLGDRHDIAPKDAAGRLWAHQLQLSVTDFVKEIHDAHHPISNALYYEEQKPESAQRTEHFLAVRAPKYLEYFEFAIARNPANLGFTIGDAPSYPDLSIFQLVAGLRYAFPRAMARIEPGYPGISALHDTVAALPRIAAYLASERRIPFNEHGVFRHYPELDA